MSVPAQPASRGSVDELTNNHERALVLRLALPHVPVHLLQLLGRGRLRAEDRDLARGPVHELVLCAVAEAHVDRPVMCPLARIRRRERGHPPLEVGKFERTSETRCNAITTRWRPCFSCLACEGVRASRLPRFGIENVSSLIQPARAASAQLGNEDVHSVPAVAPRST